MKLLTYILILVIITILALLIIHQRSTNLPEGSYTITSDPIDVMSEPNQFPVNEEKFELEISQKGKDYRVVITPMFYYDVSGKVVSVRKWKGWEESDCPVWKEIFPIDFGIAWGKMAVEEYAQYLKFFHTPASRFLHWRYKFPPEGPSLDLKYMIKHFSNNHLSTSNETIRAVLHSVRKGDLVRIEGWLIKLDLYEDGRNMFSARSSTTRDDKWGGACESIYVKKIQINDRIFE